MKPVLEHLPRDADESFVVRHFDYEYYPTPWHFHPEYELVLVTESTGKRFIGDNVNDFGPGNLALIGPNLPHLYKNDPLYYAGKPGLRARSIVVHFLDSSFGENFFNLPETKAVRSLLARSARGLEVTGRTNLLITQKLNELLALSGLPRFLCLLNILEILSVSDECTNISGNAIAGANETESDRLNNVFEFVSKNFHRDIRMAEIAELVHMAENSFSRYFSQRTRKPFSQYLLEFRLNHAANLLVEGQMSISEICFTCGFNSISNFNKQFRKQYDMNPLGYRTLYRNKISL